VSAELTGRWSVERRLLEQGFSACKIDPFMPAFPLPRDIPLKDLKHAASIFRHIREAVGDDLEVGIGTHGQFSTAVMPSRAPRWKLSSAWAKLSRDQTGRSSSASCLTSPK